MKILVDAMGGDLAPAAAVAGSIQAVRDFGVQVVLLGREDAIREALGAEIPEGITVVHCPDEVDMHDDPARVVRTRKDSSMVVGLTMLKNGEADALVSAGSTGALLSAATLIVKRVKGIRRAAMGPVIPARDRSTVLIDCGATAEATAEFLLQFAYMGAFYSRKVLGVADPKVALLNIGTEDSKGGQLQKDAYALLAEAGKTGRIHFIGNIEAREVPLGGADVVVSDGFSGNVLLKSIEGTSIYMAGMMKAMFKKNIFTKLAALICSSGIGAFKKKLDYRETGGTALLGLTKPVIKAHGSSDALAFRNAIRQAKENAEADIAAEIEKYLPYMTMQKEEDHAGT